MVGTLIVRADVSVEMGTGHVMRCLALSQAWQDAGGNVIFAMAQTTEGIRARLDREKIEILDLKSPAGTEQDASEVACVASEHSASWMIVDGYQFDAHYQEKLKAAGKRLMVIDDYGHASRYCADFVLNQNISAQPELYGSRNAD